jgi:hypothetical protein
VHRVARELAKTGVDETCAIETAYPIMMRLHSLVTSRRRSGPGSGGWRPNASSRSIDSSD